MYSPMGESSTLLDAKGDQTTGDNTTQPPRVIEVIQLLEAPDIPSCIVGTRALRYFGAGRVADEWDICIQDHQLDAALEIIKNTEKYEPTDSPYPNPDSLRHKYTTFKSKDSDFSFLLAPSSDSFCDPRPEFCEHSHTGIPYPQDIPFAKCLLVKQNGSDLADFIDAQNLTSEWGEKNIDFAELQVKGLEYATRMNAKLAEDPQSPSLMNVGRDLKKDWIRLADSKEKRIEPMKQGRYITRWRLKSRPGDPRLNHCRTGV